MRVRLGFVIYILTVLSISWAGDERETGVCKQLNISNVVNRGFVDKPDRVGGWLNLGADALQGMKPGKFSVRDADFAIEDPSTNANKAVLVLSQCEKLFAPFLVSAEISVDAIADHLYILHSYALAGKDGFEASIDWVYENGTNASTLIELGTHLGADWYSKGFDVPKARPVAIKNTGNQVNKTLNLYAAYVRNPNPSLRVTSIILRAPRSPFYWMVFALSLSHGQGNLLGLGQAPLPTEIVVNRSLPLGKIRKVQGMNLGPSIRRQTYAIFDTTAVITALQPPIIRLHDCSLAEGLPVVDVPSIFPLLHLDPGDERNYHFAHTDDYIQTCLSTGAEVMYRLGVSIEHSLKKYNTNPPKDYDKWAEVCCQIISHYNEGWANGFRHGIRYWEIWNEPNLGPKMWTGSFEEYIRFYIHTAKKIKARYPDIKIGGPSLAGANTRLIKQFLEACRKEKAPLDFFGWHIYAFHPARVYGSVEEVQELLDEYGFQNTELHLSEWHYEPLGLGFSDPAMLMRRDREMNGLDSAAFTAATLIGFQGTTLEMSEFYASSEVSWSWRLFDPITCAPEKTYYGILAFKEMTKYETKVGVDVVNADGIWQIAGVAPDGSVGILISRFRDGLSEREIRLKIPGQNINRDSCRVRIVNDINNLTDSTTFNISGNTIFLTSNSESEIFLIELK